MFTRSDNLSRHVKSHHSQQGGSLRKRDIRTAFNGSIAVETIHANNEDVGLLEFLHNVKDDVQNSLPIHQKIYFTVGVTMEKDEKQDEAAFRSKVECYTAREQFDDIYERAVTKIVKSMESFLKNGSGWTLGKVKRMEIRRLRYSMCR